MHINASQTLADTLVAPRLVTWPRAAVDLVLVVTGALLVAALAQIEIPLGFTPVPITGQTLGVGLVAASLGSRRGAGSMLLYVALGAIGLPFYSGGAGGWTHTFGPTLGYLAGFVLAAALVGWAAERRADRNPFKAFLALQLGSLVIFACGVSWLAFSLDLSFGQAMNLGWWPFVPGDLIKTALAAGLLPAAWALVARIRSEDAS